MSNRKKLVELQQRMGLTSYEALAKALGYQGASSVERYLADQKFDTEPYPAKFIRRLRRHLEGKGDPKITANEILSMSGISELLDGAPGYKITGSGASIISGHYVPVYTLRDAMIARTKEAPASLTPIEEAFSDRPLAVDEVAVRLEDESMAPEFPRGAMAVIRMGEDDCPVEFAPNSIVFIHVMKQDVCAIRRYHSKGYDACGNKIDRFVADNQAFDDYTSSDAVPIRVLGRVVRVHIIREL